VQPLAVQSLQGVQDKTTLPWRLILAGALRCKSDAAVYVLGRVDAG
jgi:hypothetical protein